MFSVGQVFTVNGEYYEIIPLKISAMTRPKKAIKISEDKLKKVGAVSTIATLLSKLSK